MKLIINARFFKNNQLLRRIENILYIYFILEWPKQLEALILFIILIKIRCDMKNALII